MDLRALGQVEFAYGEAERLAAALRATALELESQVGSRRACAVTALAQWRGTFAEQFRQDTEVGARNGTEFATALRSAASQLDQLVTEAREEQRRRDVAADWQAEQDRESWIEKTWERATGTDEKVPPVPPTGDGRHLRPRAPAVPARF